MCLIIFTEKKTRKEAIASEKKVAEKDITVHKIVDRSENLHKGKYVGYYQSRFYYDVGWHYYQTGVKFTFSFDKFMGKLEINRGLHSYRRRGAIGNWKTEPVLKCIIPKGSEYFLNGEEYCSDNLITVKEV